MTATTGRNNARRQRTPTGKTNELLARTVTQLVSEIEAGASGPWQMPWQRLSADILNPTNAATGHRYTGGNRWMLGMAAMLEDLDGGTWATYRQWQQIGAQVRKAESALGAVMRPIEFKRTETDDVTGEETRFTRTGFRPIAVFHSSQVDGWAPDVQLVDHEPIAEAEALVTTWRSAGMAIVEGGDSAHYRPATDDIHMPGRGQFRQIEHWYSTLFHEAGHWTGAAHRLGRDMTSRYGDDRYAAEELVAEMTAAVLGATVGIEQAARQDLVSYTAGWLRILRKDPQHLWSLAGLAEAAANYLLALARPNGDD